MTVLGDSAYGSGDFRGALGCGQACRSASSPRLLRPAVAGGFTIDDFIVDHAARTATCPARITRAITARGYATFGVACRAARCGRGAPPVPPASLCRPARTTRSNAPPANDRESRTGSTNIDNTARWSNAPSPG